MSKKMRETVENKVDETIITNNSLSLNQTKICPICGEKYFDEQGLLITFTDIAGYYCMRCYAEWIVKNISKLVDIKLNDNND